MVIDEIGSGSIPPPPPLPSLRSSVRGEREVLRKENDVLDWETELKKSFHRINSDGNYTGFYVYNHVDSIIQEGPTCGLVALAMASQCLGQALTVDEALKVARDKQFSSYGEMFSARQMQQLSEELINARVILMYNLAENKPLVIDHLAKGWPLLVPYDSDANHEPAAKGGHRAHWAVVLGFCVLQPCESQENTSEQLVSIRGDINPDLMPILRNCPDSLFMTLAKQGKSKYIKWWPFDKLCCSNSGLERVNPKIKNSETASNFVLPEDGELKESLANQFLMIKPL